MYWSAFCVSEFGSWKSDPIGVSKTSVEMLSQEWENGQDAPRAHHPWLRN